jgi:hypothetical protein
MLSKLAALAAEVKERSGIRGALAVAMVGGAVALAPSSALALATPNIKSITPPGAGDITTLIGYVLWGATAVLILGVIGFVMKAASAHHFGRSAQEHVGALGTVLGCAVLLGAMGSLLNGLL